MNHKGDKFESWAIQRALLLRRLFRWAKTKDVKETSGANIVLALLWFALGHGKLLQNHRAGIDYYGRMHAARTDNFIRFVHQLADLPRAVVVELDTFYRGYDWGSPKHNNKACESTIYSYSIGGLRQEQIQEQNEPTFGLRKLRTIACVVSE